MSNNPVDLYVKTISEQAAKEGGLSKAENNYAVKAGKEYDTHKKLDLKGHNLKMHGVDGYHHRHSDGPDQGYIIRHKSGKVSMTDIDHTQHDGPKDYEAVSRERNKHLSDAEHKEVGAAIHKAYSHYGD